MPELRWALLILGAVFVLGLAIWEWRRSRRSHAQAAPEVAVSTMPSTAADDPVRRIEPRIDSLLGARGERALPVTPVIDDVPVVQPAEPFIDGGGVRNAGSAAGPGRAAAEALSMPAEPLSVKVSQESAVDVPASAIRWPPESADRVLSLRIVNAHGALLAGRALRQALEGAGMVHGPQRIYHRVGIDGAVLASAAHMLRPGDLDPASMDEQHFRGVSMFCVLPGPLPATDMLDELVGLTRTVATRLGAVVQDEQGQALDAERLVGLRQSLVGAAEGT